MSLFTNAAKSKQRKQLRDLPNVVGVKFVGLTHSGAEIVCHIAIKDNMHFISDSAGNSVYSKLVGWYQQ